MIKFIGSRNDWNLTLANRLFMFSVGSEKYVLKEKCDEQCDVVYTMYPLKSDRSNLIHHFSTMMLADAYMYIAQNHIYSLSKRLISDSAVTEAERGNPNPIFDEMMTLLESKLTPADGGYRRITLVEISHLIARVLNSVEPDAETVFARDIAIRMDPISCILTSMFGVPQKLISSATSIILEISSKIGDISDYCMSDGIQFQKLFDDIKLHDDRIVAQITRIANGDISEDYYDILTVGIISLCDMFGCLDIDKPMPDHEIVNVVYLLVKVIVSLICERFGFGDMGFKDYAAQLFERRALQITHEVISAVNDFANYKIDAIIVAE